MLYVDMSMISDRASKSKYSDGILVAAYLKRRIN